MPYLRKQRRQRLIQHSPFLALPAEIRNQIYMAALVSPLPIDLCPASYIDSYENLERDNVLRTRYLTFQDSDAARTAELSKRPTKIAFRIQSSLQYVRKQLAVGLLATSRQVFDEAAQYFWGDNVWRFSDDRDWKVLLRFLLTIGPSSKLMIRKLDVLASTWKIDNVLPRDSTWRVKNQPKLHMVRLFNNNEERHDVVWELGAREKWLRRLDLIVPAGYGLHALESQYSWGYDWDDLMMRFNVKTRIVVESGGELCDKESILQEGWDIIALPGSRLLKTCDDVSGIIPLDDQALSWESDVDYLTGVIQLFAIEEISVHANGGRINTAGNRKDSERFLKGFGPCMILVEWIPCHCWRCGWSPEYHGPSDIRYRSIVDLRERELLEWLGAFDILPSLSDDVTD